MIYMIFLFFTFAILAFVFYHWQHLMLFSPTYHREEVLDDDFEILSIVADDGLELEGVVYEPRELYRKLPTIDSTLLFFGGREQDSVGLIKRLSLSFPHTRIITFNYRSYGKNRGRLNEKNILRDGLKIAQVVKKNYGDIYILGFSIGSSVASFVASKIDILGLFLVGTYDSVPLLIKEKYGFHIPWILRFRFDKRKFVKDIDSKTYIFASKSDEVTYIQNVRNLKQHVKNLTIYKELEDVSHGELLWDEEVTNTINEAIHK